MFTDDQNDTSRYCQEDHSEFGPQNDVGQPPSYDSVTETIWQQRVGDDDDDDDDDDSENSAHGYNETIEMASAQPARLSRHGSWSAVVDRNVAARETLTRTRTQGPSLRFYCEDCDDERKADYLVDGIFYPGQVVTMDGNDVASSVFVERELPRGPNIAGWKKKQNRGWLYVSIFMHLGIMLCLGMSYFVYFHQPQVAHSVGLGLCFACAGLCLLFIIIELCVAYARGYVMNIKSQAEAQQHAHELRHSTPRLYVKATRYETTRSKGVDNPNCVAFTEKREIPVNFWRDLSRELDFSKELEETPRCMVRIRVAVGFVDLETLTKCRRTAAVLKREADKVAGNRTEVKTYIKLPGLKDHDRLTVARGANWCEWLYLPILYWLTGPTLLHWCFRVWFNATAKKVNFTIIKIVRTPYDLDDSSSSVSLEYDGYDEHNF